MSFDGNSWRILQTLKGHVSDVTCCDFAPNCTLVTGSSDKSIRIWDWKSGSGYIERSCSPLKGHKYQVTCVRVSPQGSMLVSSSVDGTAVLWNIHNCLKLYTMTQVNGDAIRVCRFSPDSAILVTAGDNGAVCIWDLVHRSLIRILFEHDGTTNALAFTPDSQYLVTACSLEVIKIWFVQDVMDTTSEFCSPVAKIDNAHDMGVFCMDISRHVQFDESDPLSRKYKLATCGNTNEIKIWTITSKSMLKHKASTSHMVSIALIDIFDGHTSSVTCIRFNHNGSYLVSSSLDKLVKVWDDLGSCVATLEGHTRYVNCVAISRDASLLVSGSNDKAIIIWDIMGNLTLDSELDQFRMSNPYVNSIPETQLVDNTDIMANEVTLVEKIDDVADGAINSCCFYGKNILATGSGDKLIRIFKVAEENNGLEELNFSPLEGHTYAINHIEFSRNGSYIVSCSLDGYTNIWYANTGEKYISLPKNGMSIRVCRFSPDDQYLITAGDDERAIIWNINTKEKIVSLNAHLDSISSACFSPDGKIIVTASINSDFRIWSMLNYNCIFVKEDAHDYGIQCCDMSQNITPIPNVPVDSQTYLLATCGNDSYVNLWIILIPKTEDDLKNIQVKLWRCLQGHGGNVLCVRFSQIISEFICSTATDRQARIWSVYNTECLFVLDHDSIVTACSFNIDCSLIVTGCQDKTLWMWKLPQHLVFQTTVASKINCRTKQVIDWSNADVVKWLEYINLQEIIEVVQNTSLDGRKLLTFTEEQICSGLELDEELTEKFIKDIKWLKKKEMHMELLDTTHIPHEYICPITHEIMREPVTCSDGYTYEKNAINEWFMSGKLTSPMTNEVLTSSDYVYNSQLRNSINDFLEENNSD